MSALLSRFFFFHKVIKDLRVHAERWNACRSENGKTFMGKPMKHIMKETGVEKVRFPV
jgi:hypothetical protein